MGVNVFKEESEIFGSSLGSSVASIETWKLLTKALTAENLLMAVMILSKEQP